MGAFYGSKSAFVIDFKEKKLKAGYHYDDYVKDAMCSPDEKTLFVIFEDSLKIIDITTGNEKDISSLNLIPNEKSSVNAPSIACSSDGRYFSFFCKDSIIRVIDTADYSVKAELPCYSTFVPATFFSGDNHTFIFQGSDNIIYFYNLEKGEFTNLLRVDNTIKHVIYDGEENLISLATYNTNYLFGTSDYGLLAVIGDSATFLKDRNVFLVFQINDGGSAAYRKSSDLERGRGNHVTQSMMVDDGKDSGLGHAVYGLAVAGMIHEQDVLAGGIGQHFGNRNAETL